MDWDKLKGHQWYRAALSLNGEAVPVALCWFGATAPISLTEPPAMQREFRPSVCGRFGKQIATRDDLTILEELPDPWGNLLAVLDACCPGLTSSLEEKTIFRAQILAKRNQCPPTPTPPPASPS